MDDLKLSHALTLTYSIDPGVDDERSVGHGVCFRGGYNLPLVESTKTRRDNKGWSPSEGTGDSIAFLCECMHA